MSEMSRINLSLPLQDRHDVQSTWRRVRPALGEEKVNAERASRNEATTYDNRRGDESHLEQRGDELLEYRVDGVLLRRRVEVTEDLEEACVERGGSGVERAGKEAGRWGEEEGRSAQPKYLVRLAKAEVGSPCMA